MTFCIWLQKNRILLTLLSDHKKQTCQRSGSSRDGSCARPGERPGREQGPIQINAQNSLFQAPWKLRDMDSHVGEIVLMWGRRQVSVVNSPNSDTCTRATSLSRQLTLDCYFRRLQRSYYQKMLWCQELRYVFLDNQSFHQNVIESSSDFSPSLHRMSWKSVEWVLRKHSTKQTFIQIK